MSIAFIQSSPQSNTVGKAIAIADQAHYQRDLRGSNKLYPPFSG